MKIFDEDINYDFIENEDVKEDSVREEIITPILKALGYSAFSENKIIRSKNLEHPYIQFGTTSKKINIIPDYILQVGNKNAVIIEAKSPKEDILKGKNPEQAYSYAIHREVKVNKYVLCNGKNIVVFDVDKCEPILNLKIRELKEKWDHLYKLLSPIAFTNPHIFNYKPDLGIRLLKSGIRSDLRLYYTNAKILDVTKLNEEYYSFSLNVYFEEDCLASFDFNKDLFTDFMNQVPKSKRDNVQRLLTNQPFKYFTEKEEDSFGVSFYAVPSLKLEKGIDEVFMPFIVQEFYNKKEGKHE